MISQTGAACPVLVAAPNVGFSLLFFTGRALLRTDQTRIATPHSLFAEKFRPLGISATSVAIANDCLVARIRDDIAADFGETFRVSERLPKSGELVRIKTRVTFANNGTGRKARTYGPAECLELFAERTGLVAVAGNPPFLQTLPDQLRQGISVTGIVSLEGEFRVANEQALVLALTDGVGARRSYGFGMLMIESVCAE